MRTSQFSVEALRTFLKEHIIATMKQLKKALNTDTDMTIYRKLKQLSYHTSYSHKGKYYTLDEVANFNEQGLWKYDIARFSKYGTLIQTARTFIEKSSRGYTLAELRDQLGIEVKEPLLILFKKNLIDREHIAGRYVYFSSNPQQHRQQRLMRIETKPSLTTAETDVILAHEVRAAIILFFSFLNEQQRRLYAGLESLRIGHGGDSIISSLLDIDPHTVARGRKELLKRDIVIERIRSLMKYETAGDPITGLKWTRKATRKIAAELQKADIMVSDKTVARLLKELGFSMQANRKRIALSGNGSQKKREERDMQFRHICRMRDSFIRTKEPSISVDTKKKELIGNFKNAGRVWRDQHRDVADHDFPSYAKGKISPYGVYDTSANKASVYVGTSHDTAAFAVDSITAWWEKYGSQQYPNARRILILADSGGSNSPSNNAWNYHFWESLCQRHGLKVTVCHYPSGASKWNPIEHRLFSEISKNWAGEPLTSLQTALNFIRTTKTDSGLRVTAHLNRKYYKTQEKISESSLSKISIKHYRLLPKLNYTLQPTK